MFQMSGCFGVGSCCLGIDVVGKWLLDVLGRFFTEPYNSLIHEYVDDSAFVWIRDGYTMKLMAITSDRVITSCGADEGSMLLPIRYDGHRKMVTFMMRRKGQTMIGTYQLGTDRIAKVVSQWFNYEFSSFPVDGAPELLICTHQDEYYTIRAFNTSTMLETSALKFLPDEMPKRCHAAAVDVKTGSIFIGGVQYNRDLVVVWKHTCDQPSRKFAEGSTDGRLVHVFLARNFFGAIFFAGSPRSGIKLWTYSGLSLPDDHHCCKCRQCVNTHPYYKPLIYQDTIYYLRYCISPAKGSFWCKYRPNIKPSSPSSSLSYLSSLSSHGQMRLGLPDCFPHDLQFAGQFIVEHYRDDDYDIDQISKHILVLTHVDSLVSRTVQLQD
jgi:hypothetical protein